MLNFFFTIHSLLNTFDIEVNPGHCWPSLLSYWTFNYCPVNIALILMYKGFHNYLLRSFQSLRPEPGLMYWHNTIWKDEAELGSMDVLAEKLWEKNEKIVGLKK